MNGDKVRAVACAGAVGLLAVLAAGCGSSDEAPAGAKKLSFELTDEGCLPHKATAPAGPIAFEAENTGSSKVTEIEIMEGDAILGEKENLSEGLSGGFTLTLGAGNYIVYCPGGSNERGTLTVTGAKHVEGETKGEADGDEGE
jgi:iron uptake system component EfeO